MPDGVVGRLVKFGLSQTSVEEKVRPAVYASFNRAGRLCYRLDSGMLNCRRDGWSCQMSFTPPHCRIHPPDGLAEMHSFHFG